LIVLDPFLISKYYKIFRIKILIHIYLDPSIGLKGFWGFGDSLPLDGQLLIAATSSSISPTQAQVGPQEGDDRPDLALLDTGGVRLR